MKKKTLALIITLCMTVTAVVSFAAGAVAASGLQDITAQLNGNITVTLDGEVQTFLDAKGTRVYPITYSGSTYLPVRAVAGLVGLDVVWDQATQTVKLGKQGAVDLIDTYKAYQVDEFCGQVQTADKKTADISGVTCSRWLYLTRGVWNPGEGAISFNLLGKHDTLTFSYYSDKDATLKVLGDDGSVLGEYTITGGAVAKTVTVPLLKTSELKFLAEMPDYHGTDLKIFNAVLDAE